MKRRILAPAVVLLLPVAALVFLLALLSNPNLHRSGVVLAAPAAPDPTVTNVSPSSSRNDLDTRVVITGTGFDAGATVQLGSTTLEDAGWVSSTTLTATVPWGIDPGVYTLTVENPDDGSGNLTDAFTVTEGIGVWNAGELYGGSVESLLVNPVTPTTLYAASFHTGLFRSRDGGRSWTFQFAGGGGVMHPVIDPHSPDRLYVHGPWTLYRSDDEGESWTPLDPEFPHTGVSDARCGAVWIHPYVHPISDTVYAVACEPNQGVIKSPDHGETWMSITDGITDTDVTAFAFHPDDPNTMYVGTGNGHVFETSDGGTTWTYASQPVGYVGALVANPFGAHELWVASDNSFGDPCVLRASTNANLTAWKTLTGTTEGCHWPGPSIYFDPDIPGTVFVAGLGFEGLKTEDGGATWTSLSPGKESLVQDLAPHPTQTDTIHLADKWRGVYETTNGGDDWSLANHGLTALYPLQMDVHPDQPGTVYARLNSEEIYQGARGGESWQRLPISHAASVQIDPVTSTRIYVGRSGDPAYVYVSDDEGHSWSPSAPLSRSEAYCDSWTFPWSLFAVPEQPGTLLVGAQHHCEPLPHPGNLYRSADYGAHWQRVYTYTYRQYEMPIGFAAHPVTPTTIYAAIPNGEDGLLRSTDAGQTWERIGEGYDGMAFAQNVAVEPRPPYRIFVLTGWQSSHLYVGEDPGLTWTEAVAPPDPANVYQLLFTDAEPPLLFAAGRQRGLSRLNVAEEPWQWTQAPGALGQVPVYSLGTVADTDRVFLYAGTTGGRVEETGAEALDLTALDAAAGGTLVNAGVYRYTTRRARKVYVPLVLRSP